MPKKPTVREIRIYSILIIYLAQIGKKSKGNNICVGLTPLPVDLEILNIFKTEHIVACKNIGNIQQVVLFFLENICIIL